MLGNETCSSVISRVESAVHVVQDCTWYRLAGSITDRFAGACAAIFMFYFLVRLRWSKLPKQAFAPLGPLMLIYLKL